MTMTKTKKAKASSKKTKADITTILFSVEKNILSAKATHNSKQVNYKLIDVYAELFNNVSSKNESKKAFNVLFLQTLQLDAKSKKAGICKNTCYDRYYKLLDFLQNEVFDKKLKAKYRNKLASYNKRN